MDDHGWVVGVDIGGTKIAAAALTSGGEWLARARPRAVTPDDGEACFESLRQVVGEVVDCVAASPRAIGVSMAAVVDRRTGTVIWAPNLPAWDGFPLAERLRSEFGSPVFVDFDGHMALLGEYWLGAGRGVRNVCMMVVGTGIGGGLIADGRLIRGSCGIAGAFGWMAGEGLADVGLQMAGGRRRAEPYPGWSCRWPQIGWLESLAAGPAILARAVHLARQGFATNESTGGDTQAAAFDASCTGRYPDTRAVFAAARSGDPIASRVVAETGWLLGLVAANVASFFGPERFILGGGVGEEADLLLPPMRAAVERFAQPHAARRMELTAASLGNGAALAGAARLAWEAIGVLPAAAFGTGSE
ncbi:MAG: ROK family protein [Limnochordales bacterium]|nr:ROK family protein [Limnochordales bacterium]